MPPCLCQFLIVYSVAPLALRVGRRGHKSTCAAYGPGAYNSLEVVLRDPKLVLGVLHGKGKLVDPRSILFR